MKEGTRLKLTIPALELDGLSQPARDEFVRLVQFGEDKAVVMDSQGKLSSVLIDCLTVVNIPEEYRQ